MKAQVETNRKVEGCDPKQFAARQTELELIDNKLRLAQKASSNQRLLVEFFGLAGIGKSSLLRYLAEKYTTDFAPPTISLLINFAEFNRTEQWNDLLQNLTEQIQNQMPDKSAKQDIKASDVVDLVIDIAQSCVPLFLFDTSEQSSELIELLEDQLVYPLLRSDQVVFVFAGRRWLRWKRFEVRRRVETFELEPFDQSHGTPEQLEKLGLDSALAAALYPYSFGHPTTTRAIVDAFQTQDIAIDPNSLAQHQTIIADVVYNQVIQGRFWAELGKKNDDLKRLLELACIPRRFDVTPLKAFGSRFYPKQDYGDKPGGYYLDAIRDMQDTTLVQWNSERGGYILLPVLRWIMAKNLSMRDPEQFQDWHKQAAKQYEEWIDRYPRNAVGFLIEWIFHRAWILRAEGQPDEQVGGAVSNEASNRWADIRLKPEVQWDLTEMTETLKEKVQDQEIATFFPTLHTRMSQWNGRLGPA